MAQVGSALGSGLRGRRFKSACPDQLNKGLGDTEIAKKQQSTH
jgi:hypothetical protein